ncbi:MAG: ATP-binding protein, partial [Caldilineaceae bacterium]|nr:ATP-binding protein [Caldilineaceae bacterium]
MAETTIRTNPYPGPVAFQTGDTLYGRRRETRQLLNLLIAERIVLLYSPSGAGKTSLIQAALIPELEREGFRVFRPARVSLEAEEQVSGIANRYIFSLLLSLEAHLPEGAEPLTHSELATVTLSDYLALRAPHGANPIDADQSSEEAKSWDDEWHGDVLIFDQFEEILTVDPTDRDAKHEFFRQVGEALQDRQRWALFALREEFLAGLDPYVRPIPTRFATTFRLELLGPDAARQAMQRPAANHGVTFTDAAADKLINDLRTVQVMEPDGSTHPALGDAIEPVQLQVVCLRLWNGLAPDDARIDAQDVDDFGDVDQALRAYYTETVDK